MWEMYGDMHRNVLQQIVSVSDSIVSWLGELSGESARRVQPLSPLINDLTSCVSMEVNALEGAAADCVSI